MTFPEEMTMYCTICGGPIFDSGSCLWNKAPMWLSSAVLLSQEEPAGRAAATSDPTILYVPAVTRGGPYFTTNAAASPLEVTACNVAILSPLVNPKPTLYLPLHTACLSIVFAVTKSTSTMTPNKSLNRVWQVLRARFVSTGKGRRIPPTKLREPSGYYGITMFQDMEWERYEEGSELNRAAQYFEADPSKITALTSTLLTNLQSRFKQPIQPTFAEPRCSSPFQIHDLMNLIDLEPRSRQALLDGNAFPWMPSLDKDKVQTKEVKVERALEAQFEWDWESLERQIGALAFKNGPIEMEKNEMMVPKGLWNRRRIWQLVEDILGTKPKQIACL